LARKLDGFGSIIQLRGLWPAQVGRLTVAAERKAGAFPDSAAKNGVFWPKIAKIFAFSMIFPCFSAPGGCILA
jgi:hypothetical protein